MRLTRIQLRRLIESTLYEDGKNKKKVTPETIRNVLKNNFSSYDIISAPVRDDKASLGTLFAIDINSAYDREEDFGKKELKKEFIRVLNILSEFNNKNKGFSVAGIEEQLAFLEIDENDERMEYIIAAKEILFQGGSAQTKIIRRSGSKDDDDISSMAEEGFSGSDLGSIIEENDDLLNDGIMFLVVFD